MVKKDQSVLICCSGGIDSMVLLELMRSAAVQLNLTIGAVHIDHGLRGEASKHDALFVQKTCKKLQIPCYVFELKMDPHTPNLEEQARKKRYAAIMDCKSQHGFQFAATGHIMDDQAETLVYRFIRGSGIRGFSGMDYLRTDGIIRPLLDFSRADIEAFAEENHINHVVDHTNEDVKLARNLIRHKIIPLMEKINPCAVHAIARFSNIAREEGRVLDEMAMQLLQESSILDWGLIRAFRKDNMLKAKDAVIKRLIINVVSGMIDESRGVDAIQIDAALEVIQGISRSHNIKRRVQVSVDRDNIIFATSRKGPYYTMSVNAPGMYHLTEINQTIYVNFHGEVPAPLMLRSYMPGDRMNNKKVAEIMSDHGILKSLRPFWPVLVNKDEVIAIAGIKDPCSYESVFMEFPYVA